MAEFIGKGAEILKSIVEHGPCSQYYLREKVRRWSSRTVSKQIRRFERDQMICRSSQGYEVTDHGFYTLIVASRGSERTVLLRKAIAKYPDGQTQRSLGWMLAKPPLKHDIEKMVIEDLKKPNVFVACRTDMNGKIARAVLISHAVDLETGRSNVKVLKRLPSRIRPRWRTINLR